MSDYSWNYFNILTNISALLPSILFIYDRNYYDFIVVLGTGLISFLYHLNNNKPQVLTQLIFNENAIRDSDEIMSYILVIQVASYLSFYKDYYTRSIILFLYLPFAMYYCLSANYYHIYILLGYVGLISLTTVYNLYIKNLIKIENMILLAIGLALSIIEIILYIQLQEDNVKDYNMYHGFHHLCAFISIIFYYLVPMRIKFSKYCIIQTDEDTINPILPIVNMSHLPTISPIRTITNSPSTNILHDIIDYTVSPIIRRGEHIAESPIRSIKAD
jgi:hypothetical protein